MKSTLVIGCGKYRGRTNSVLQQAVDALATKGGGTVEIPRGVYWMHDALHLRDDVHVVGEKGTILRKVPSISSPLADYIGYGHYEFTVAEPEKFRPGMGVLIQDRNASGFYTTVATITAKRGSLIFTSRMMNHDYNPKKGGRVVTVFSLVEACNVRNVSAKNLTLDGNPLETRALNGCRGGGVFLLQTHNVKLENIEVVNYHGDGISFQQCTDVWIHRCHVHHNQGGGIHPGSGSVRYVIRENRVHHNKGCGIFYCLRTTHSICEKNVIEENRGDGVSIGERDTDHLVRENVIRRQGGAGISFRKPFLHGADRVRVERNVLEHNCRRTGCHEIVVSEKLNDIMICDNEILSSGPKAVKIGPGCRRIWVANNRINGVPQTPSRIAVVRGAAAFKVAPDFPPVGPAAASDDHAAHLKLLRHR
jgi:hypothetical protein